MGGGHWRKGGASDWILTAVQPSLCPPTICGIPISFIPAPFDTDRPNARFLRRPTWCLGRQNNSLVTGTAHLKLPARAVNAAAPPKMTKPEAPSEKLPLTQTLAFGVGNMANQIFDGGIQYI